MPFQLEQSEVFQKVVADYKITEFSAFLEEGVIQVRYIKRDENGVRVGRGSYTITDIPAFVTVANGLFDGDIYTALKLALYQKMQDELNLDGAPE